jgi:hypothetical protein
MTFLRSVLDHALHVPPFMMSFLFLICCLGKLEGLYDTGSSIIS